MRSEKRSLAINEMKEAIEKIKNIDTLSINDMITNQKVDMVIKNQVLDIISQIDEPQKVVVPAFIDSFIGYAKAEGMSLFSAMDNAQNKESEWIITHEETFARAWLDGYEIEQEKLYTVEIPNHNGSGYSKIYLAKNKDGKVELFIWSCYTSIDFSDNWKQEENARLTEAEIKQDFEWAWKWAKGVE